MRLSIFLKRTGMAAKAQAEVLARAMASAAVISRLLSETATTSAPAANARSSEGNPVATTVRHPARAKGTAESSAPVRSSDTSAVCG
jgi:hypothetical protein